MSFPLVSTSVITRQTRRAGKVLNRSKVADLIHQGEVYNCRTVAGSTTYSQHAWGNAVDLMADPANLERIARNVLLQARGLTLANRGRKLKVATIIYSDLCWDLANPTWHHYSGEPHTTHVHVDFVHTRSGTPPCAA